MRARVAVLVIGVLLAACGGGTGATNPSEAAPTTAPRGADTTTAGAAASELAAARDRWEARRPDGYRYTAQVGWDWGSEGGYEVWVNGDRAVEIPPPGAAALPWHRFGTIEDLFDLVAGIPPPWLLEVAFDPEWGFPTLILVRNVEEWTMWIGGFVEADLVPPGATSPSVSLPWMSARRIQEIDAVVEGIPGDLDTTAADQVAWEVGFSIDTVHFVASPGSLPAGTMTVVDPVAGPLPPVLQHLGGRRVILFLTRGRGGTWRVLWVAERDRGLQFAAPRQAVPFLNAELPRLCVLAADRSTATVAAPRDAERELGLLVAWIGELHGMRSRGERPTPERAEEALERLCRASPEWAPASG